MLMYSSSLSLAASLNVYFSQNSFTTYSGSSFSNTLISFEVALGLSISILKTQTGSCTTESWVLIGVGFFNPGGLFGSVMFFPCYLSFDAPFRRGEISLMLVLSLSSPSLDFSLINESGSLVAERSLIFVSGMECSRTYSLMNLWLSSSRESYMYLLINSLLSSSSWRSWLSLGAGRGDRADLAEPFAPP